MDRTEQRDRTRTVNRERFAFTEVLDAVHTDHGAPLTVDLVAELGVSLGAANESNAAVGTPT